MTHFSDIAALRPSSEFRTRMSIGMRGLRQGGFP